MRQKFEQQLSLGVVPITEVRISLKSRDELPPVLAGLQYIFSNPDLNEKVFDLLEKKVCGGKKKTGRKGMDLWEMFVLATVRLTLDINYDRLLYVANHDSLVRQIMGIHYPDYQFKEGKEYSMQTIRDNVTLLDEQTINEINQLVVEAGHRLVKKKRDLVLEVKADTYVFETNVHFPTDLGLLWDSGRKCIDTLNKLRDTFGLEGWRKGSFWRAELKKAFRQSGRACYRGSVNRQKRLEEAVSQYLRIAEELSKKIDDFLPSIDLLPGDVMNQLVIQFLKTDLIGYQKYLLKFMDQVKRRLLREEKIPTEEKIYSIFEEHTEWLAKGKIGKNVELGHKIAVATDQFQFIIFHKVIENQHDTELTLDLAREVTQRYNVQSMSFDKGFYSAENKTELKKIIPMAILPKRGKRNQAETEEERSKEFRKLKNSHSAIESNINQLEHHGLNRCPDKGLKNYKTYVAIGVLSYNLHRLGDLLIAAKRKQEEKDRSRIAA